MLTSAWRHLPQPRAEISGCDSPAAISSLRASPAIPNPSLKSPRSARPSAPNPNPGDAARPSIYHAGVATAAAASTLFPTTWATPGPSRDHHLLPRDLVHSSDTFSEFFRSRIDAPVLGRSSPPPRRTPAGPRRRSGTSSATPPRHRACLAAIHAVVDSPEHEHHRRSHAVHARSGAPPYSSSLATQRRPVRTLAPCPSVLNRSDPSDLDRTHQIR